MNELTVRPSYNYIEPSDLLIESIEPENIQLNTQVLESDVYNGYDVDYEETDLDSSMVKQNDFHIGAGVYFDIDKQKQEEEEECEKKKKFWFLPFSVEQNHTTMINSNLVVSNLGKTGGLLSMNQFQRKPIKNCIYKLSLSLKIMVH